jgi:hypothetical protein
MASSPHDIARTTGAPPPPRDMSQSPTPSSPHDIARTTGSNIFWTNSFGYTYTVAMANDLLARSGYAWQIPAGIKIGSAEHSRIQNQLNLVEARITSGEPALNPAWDFDIDAEGGLGEYSNWVQAGRPGAGGGGGGYGGGGGRQGPVFVAADPEAVAESVKAYVVAVTGTLHQDIIDQATKAWQDAYRRDFDNPEQQVDPNTAMRESVRGTDIYKHVHQVRPESVDEMQWVTGRQGQLRQLGLDASLAERVGIDLSEVGSADPATRRGGEMAQVGATGRLLSSQRERLKQKTTAALGLI